MRSLTITTEPETTIWVNDIRYGETGEDGRLTVKVPKTGRLTARARAYGFEEASKILSTAATEVSIVLTKTEDPAILAYQEADKAGNTQ